MVVVIRAEQTQIKLMTPNDGKGSQKHHITSTHVSVNVESVFSPLKHYGYLRGIYSIFDHLITFTPHVSIT